jgi:predicted hydrocarbon binding protein
MGNIRGQSILSLMKYLRNNFGEEGYKKALDTLDLIDREVFKGKVSPMGWYPAGAFINMMEATENIFGTGDYKLCERIGHFSAEESFGGIYRIFIELSDARVIIGKASLAWRIINDVGNLEMSAITGTSAKCRIKGYDYPKKAFCFELAGYFTKVLELVGARNVKIVEKKCRTSGAEYCEYEVTWE